MDAKCNLHYLLVIYKTGFKPIRLQCESKYVRAWPGGTGAAKVSSLYEDEK